MNIDFDYGSAPAQGDMSGSPIPEGEYVFHVTRADPQRTKRDHGMELDMEFECKSAPHVGRKFWQQLFYKADSPDSLTDGQRKNLDICKGQLKAIIDSVGIQRFNGDIGSVMHKPLGVKVKIELGEDNGKGGVYPDKNRIAFIKPAAEVVVGASATTFSARPAQAKPTGQPSFANAQSPVVAQAEQRTAQPAFAQQAAQPQQQPATASVPAEAVQVPASFQGLPPAAQAAVSAIPPSPPWAQ